jgi:uncharacterized protein (TIGR03083 family)
MAGMDVETHTAAVAEQGALLAAAAEGTDPGAAVPTCPEWTLRDLVRHTGGVHRWATAFVVEGRTEPWPADLEEVAGGWPTDSGLTEWFRAGLAGLVAALAGADPDLECWSFLPAPSPLAMWARRQAHETTIHRVDAELAAARPVTEIPPALAADGIDELLTCFAPRRRMPGRDGGPRVVAIRPTDVGQGWLVTVGPDGARTTVEEAVGNEAPDCVVSGPASDLYRALWHRPGPDALAVAGDGEVAQALLGRLHVNWS